MQFGIFPWHLPDLRPSELDALNRWIAAENRRGASDG